MTDYVYLFCEDLAIFNTLAIALFAVLGHPILPL